MTFEGNAHFNPCIAEQSSLWISQTLLASLIEIHQQIQSHAKMAECAGALNHLITRVNTALSDKQFLSPLLYAGYYHCVYLLEQGDLDHCVQLLEDLPCGMSQPIVVNGTLGFCHSDMHRSLMQNCLYSETQEPYWSECNAHEFQQAQIKISAIIALIQNTNSNFYHEFQALVTTIVISKPSSQRFRFDGASSYHLWGLMMLAWDNNKSDLEWIETLAHESSHIYLFGLTQDQVLLEEDNSGKTYSSPLRMDKRPLEGIYHATYVSAKMYFAVNHYRDSNSTLFKLEEIDRLTSASLKAFNDGYQTIMQHAQLTELGKTILQDCKVALDFESQTTRI